MKMNTFGYFIKNTYSDENENEFSIFELGSNVMLGYYIVRPDSIEVYYSPDDENVDFSCNDFVNTTDEALDLILTF